MIGIFPTIHLGAKNWFSIGEIKTLNTDGVVNAAMLSAIQVDASIESFKLLPSHHTQVVSGPRRERIEWVHYTMPLVWLFEESVTGQYYLKGVEVNVWKAVRRDV
jgi:hypothetical protein